MDGIKYFQTKCDAHNIPWAEWFITGSGGHTAAEEFEQHLSSNTKSQHYLIKYIKNEEFYIAWNIQTPKTPKRSKFSVKKAAVREKLFSREYGIVMKNVEHRGKVREPVYVFTRNGIDEFLKTVILARVNNLN